MITLMFGSTLAQKARHFCARFTSIATLVVPANFRAAVAILGNLGLVPDDVDLMSPSNSRYTCSRLVGPW